MRYNGDNRPTESEASQMEKADWRAIVETDWAVPTDRTAHSLAPDLLAALGSPDPELRDAFAYPILEHWIHNRLYSDDDLRTLIARLAENLMAGLGEEATDSVFLRAFSVLMLAEIVHEDNVRPFLNEAEVRQLLELALAYQAAERDVRGWVPEKGWAHTIAHTADLLWVLARNRYLGSHDLERILDGVAAVLLASSAPFLCDEDERLAQPVVAALRRGLLAPAFITAWLGRLADPADRASWAESFLIGQDLAPRLNVKQFLRSVYLQLTLSGAAAAGLADARAALLGSLSTLSQWYLHD
jgi:hypothetical protein